MNHYRAQFGLPACTSASGCFTKLNQKGEAGHYPPQDFGWGVESSLDLQMISTACPTCHIVLVEANQPTDKSLGRAEQAAVKAGATVTNHSYGRIELTATDAQGRCTTTRASPRWPRPATSATGRPASRPARRRSSRWAARRSPAPRPTRVAGRRRPGGSPGRAARRTSTRSVGQTDTACHMRTDTDVSAVAKGLAIYNTSLPRRFRGWLEVDGTSASSPLIAGMIGAARPWRHAAGRLYAGPADAFNDVAPAGRNGFCQGQLHLHRRPGVRRSDRPRYAEGRRLVRPPAGLTGPRQQSRAGGVREDTTGSRRTSGPTAGSSGPVLSRRLRDAGREQSDGCLRRRSGRGRVGHQAMPGVVGQEQDLEVELEVPDLGMVEGLDAAEVQFWTGCLRPERGELVAGEASARRPGRPAAGPRGIGRRSTAAMRRRGPPPRPSARTDRAGGRRGTASGSGSAGRPDCSARRRRSDRRAARGRGGSTPAPRCADPARRRGRRPSRRPAARCRAGRGRGVALDASWRAPDAQGRADAFARPRRAPVPWAIASITDSDACVL